MRQKRSRQHDPKCKIKSSQYTLIVPLRVIQLTTISIWVPETRQQIGQFPPKRLKYGHGHPIFIFISSSSTAELSLFALNQSEARFTELGEYSQNMLSKAFWTPNIASSPFDKYPELVPKQTVAQLRTGLSPPGPPCHSRVQ